MGANLCTWRVFVCRTNAYCSRHDFLGLGESFFYKRRFLSVRPLRGRLGELKDVVLCWFYSSFVHTNTHFSKRKKLYFSLSQFRPLAPWDRLISRKWAEVRKWGSVISHFPYLFKHRKKNIWENPFFFSLFPFTQLFPHLQGAIVNFVVM